MRVPPRRERSTSAAVTVYLIVLLSLQIFLLTVALDGLLSRETGLAWVSGVLSGLLFVGTLLFYRWLREAR